MKRSAAFLGLSAVGVVVLLVGLSLDAWLHAHDPGLAAREGIFTLTNPGHALMALGTITVVAGIGGAAFWLLPAVTALRRLFLVAAGVSVLAAGGTIAWDAQLEQQSHIQGHATVAAATSHHDTATPGQAPTATQLEAAAKLLEDTRAAVQPYQDLGAAKLAGYVPVTPPLLTIVHYVNPAYMTAADILNPTHVQSLIYVNTTRGPVLAGAMYIMPRVGMPGPEIGGPLTNWHHHDNLCFSNQLGIVVALTNGGTCPAGSTNRVTPDMLHVWLIDNPNGPFDSNMSPSALQAVLNG
jgi:hypothetical protein